MDNLEPLIMITGFVVNIMMMMLGFVRLRVSAENRFTSLEVNQQHVQKDIDEIKVRLNGGNT